MICYSQDEIKRTYFKDKYAKKESKNDKGKYLMIEFQINDSIIKKEFVNNQSNTKIWSKEYLNDKPFGEWIFYNESGEIDYMFDYNFVLRYGEIVPDNYLKLDFKKKQLVDKNNADFSMPYLDSPENGFQRYIVQNLRYPEFAVVNGVQGTVHIQLTIDKEGKVDNISVVRGVEESMDRETYRLIHSMPDWTPAKLNGEPINVYLILPITYRLQ
jgi:TonB family protein